MADKDQSNPLRPASIWKSSSDEDHQSKPFAPVSIWKFRSEEDQESLSNHRKKKKYVKLCGCVAANFLIFAVTGLILGFTVFHVKSPIVWFNAIDVQSLELDGSGSLSTDKNVTLVANVFVKNPNSASFKFGNTTTTIYYKCVVVGEGRGGPPGVAKARRSMNMNITVEVILSKILAVPSSISELTKKVLTMDSYTKIDGKIKIAGIVKKHVEIKLNCTITYNISSRGDSEARLQEKSIFLDLSCEL